MTLYKKVYVSLDIKNDVNYKHMLSAWNHSNGLEFVSRYNDGGDVSSQKTLIMSLLKSANIVLTIIGSKSDSLHVKSKDIGYRNWQNFEIAKAREYKKKIVAVFIDTSFSTPVELLGAGYIKVNKFDHDSILRAIKLC